MMSRLGLCDALFDRKVRALVREAGRLPTDELLERIDSLAYYAISVVPSRLGDARIERLLVERGRQEMSLPLPAPGSSGRRKILHVSTVIHPVGGHTRIIANWIALDQGSDHAVALTCQSVPTPDWFARHLAGAGGELFELDVGLSKLERARALRQFAAGRRFTHIVVHHYPYDSIPLFAFATDGGPPVLVYNHSDQLFWNGSALADAVIDFCPSSSPVSQRSRGARATFQLPLVVGPAPTVVGRAEAKRRLGFAPETLLFVSIGRKAKYRPWRHYDFFSTCGKLLARLPQARLVVIGVSESDLPELAITTRPPHLILAGEVVDPSLYAMAADLYLECFPVGAGLGACDICRYGAAPLFVYGKGLSIDGTQGGGVFADCLLPAHPQTEAEQIELALQLCADEPARRRFGEAFASYLNSHCGGAAWLARLEAIYRATGDWEHRVASDLAMEPLAPGRRADFNAYTCSWGSLIYHSLLTEIRRWPSFVKLRALAFKLAQGRLARRLFRGAPGLLGYFGRK